MDYDVLKARVSGDIPIGSCVSVSHNKASPCSWDDKRFMGIVSRKFNGVATIRVRRYDGIDLPAYIVDMVIDWMGKNCVDTKVFITSDIIDDKGDRQRLARYLSAMNIINGSTAIGEYDIVRWSGRRTAPAKYIARKVTCK